MTRRETVKFFRLPPDDATQQSWQELRDLRARVYRERLELNTAQLAGDEEIDRSSFVFGLWSRGELKGTVRLTPATAPRLEMRDLGVFPLLENGADGVCEITRFAVAEQGLGYGEAVVHGCATWMLRHTSITRYYAYCRPAVAQYFGRALGSQVLPGQDFAIAERGIDNYRTLTGTIRDFATLTAHVRGRFAPDSLFPTTAPDWDLRPDGSTHCRTRLVASGLSPDRGFAVSER